MLFGTFFDVPNLMEVATRFADLHRGFGYLASRPAKLASRPTTVGASHEPLSATRARVGTRFHGDLEEELEAQEDQGMAVRQRATMSRNRFDGNSLEGDNLARGGTSRGPRRRVTGVPTAGRWYLRGVVASRGMSGFGWTGNEANPRVGSRMQQACEP
jgi:hypothetical protein